MRAALTSVIKTLSDEHIFVVKHYARSGLAHGALLVFDFGPMPVEQNASSLDCRVALLSSLGLTPVKHN